MRSTVMDAQPAASESNADALSARDIAAHGIGGVPDRVDPRPEDMDREALLADVARLRWLVETNPQVSWTAGATGNITDFSQRWLDLTGLTREGALGGGWAQVQHPDDLPAMAEAYARAIAKGRTYEFEHRVRRADGVYRWMRSFAAPRRGTSGEIMEWYGATEDVHERREAQDALRRSAETFERLVADSPLGIYVVDADFRLAIASQGTRRAFESVAPILGRDFGEVVRAVWPEPTASEVLAVFRRCLDAGEPHYEGQTVERRADVGEVQAYDWKVERIAMPDGRWGVVCHFHDASEAQRRERELESRVEERTRDLTRANRDLNEFAYSVAHDLRAPLRTIVSSSSILLEDTAERLTEEERSLLERQAKGANKLARIVDDLLGFARLANADVRRVTIDMTALAAEAAEAVVRRWDNGSTVSVQDGMVALGDPSLLGYALTNLLDNACKFSPEGGAVAVGEQGGVFFVRDNGIGFESRHSEKLFVAFERLVDQETFPGTGVGLANVKRIVERHGGRVWAESEPGKGATFFFKLTHG